MFIHLPPPQMPIQPTKVEVILSRPVTVKTGNYKNKKKRK